MVKVGIISNPEARHNIRNPRMITIIRRIMGAYAIVIETSTINDIPEAIQTFYDNDVEIIGINGGDGTFSAVITVIIAIYKNKPLPKIVVLCAGTMNTMPKSIGIYGRTINLVMALADHCKNWGIFNNTVKQHLIKCGNYYGTMSGMALAANFLDAYEAGLYSGWIQAISVLAQGCASAAVRGPYVKHLFKSAKCRIIIDDKELPSKEFTGILGSSIREIGLGFTPAPRAYEKEGCFHFIATNISYWDLIRQISNVWLGKEIRHNRVFSAITGNVHIIPMERMLYMVDGCVYATEDPITMEIGPTIELVKL